MAVVIRDWARSVKKRPIALYKSEENPHRPILLVGGVHGDEHEGVALAEATLAWLKSNSEKKTTPATTAPWILIPCINPDGLQAIERTNANGVDLNRNYPSRDWSPVAKTKRYNPGPHAACEPEIQALVKLIDEVKPRLVIHCHSWKPCIVCSGEPARTDAEALGRSSGFKVVEEIGYPTPGSLSRWGWHDNKIPIICIEADDKAPAYEAWLRFGDGLKEIFLNTSLRESKKP